jgi:phage tail-like protein
MATEDNNETMTVYNFKVEIDGIAVGFSRVDGLDIEYGTISYAESPTNGLPGPRRIHMPGPSKPPEAIELEKGIMKNEELEVLYDWINSIQGTRVNKKDIWVRLCDATGDAVLSWKAINAFPTKLTVSEFDAKDEDTVAIQTMTLMADRVVIETP